MEGAIFSSLGDRSYVVMKCLVIGQNRLIISPSEVLSSEIYTENKTNCLLGGLDDFTKLKGNSHFCKVYIKT